MKLITENRQARHEYFIEESYQTGIVLEGSEVKSVRKGSVNLNINRRRHEHVMYTWQDRI